MLIKCAQCETADASLWCKDENLHYCEQCSGLLHTKKARMHHHVEPFATAPICDECELAAGELECLECGGNKMALVFCKKCSFSLHSRVARRGHHIKAVSSLETKGEVEHPVAAHFVIDLTTGDSDEENRVPSSSRKEHSSRAPSMKACVKAERTSTPARVAGISNASRLSCLNENVKAEAGEEQAFPASTSHKRNAVVNEESELRRKIRKSVNLKDKARVKEEGHKMKKPTSRECKRPKPSEPLPTGSSYRGESSAPAFGTMGTDSELDGVHVIKRGAVSLEAFVVDAPDNEEEPGPSGTIPESNVESGIKNKIKNMLDLGLHPDTPEFEAQQALRNAQRLLTKYNLEQVEVMDGNLKDASSLTGGMRIVELRPKGRVKYGRMEFWIQELADVIRLNFDCQYFFKTSTPAHPLRVVFYGIRQNANCAGYAFAATFNRITIMAASYVLVDDCETKQQSGLASRGYEMRVARVNYRNGVVAGLRVALKKSKRKIDKGGSSCKSPQRSRVGAEDDHGDFECRSDNETPSDNLPKRSTSPEKSDPSAAISALVIHSKKVGEEFLKRKGIKIRIRTKRNRMCVWNAEAYKQGKIDSETIDINQKSITGGKNRNKAKQHT